MGALSPDEMERVANDIAAHPELRAELEEISRALETIAPVEGSGPSVGLRGRILDSLEPRKESDATALPPTEEAAENVIPLAPRRSWLMAASFIGLLIAGGFAFWSWSQLQETNERLAEIEDRANAAEVAYTRAADELEMLRDRENTVVRMSATNEDAQAFAVLYWNPEDRTVWIDAHQMPPLAEGEQYQLWAIDEDGPADAGVFDGSTEGLQKLKPVEKADQFAVTVEPEGGSETPTLERMTVIGQL